MSFGLPQGLASSVGARFASARKLAQRFKTRWIALQKFLAHDRLDTDSRWPLYAALGMAAAIFALDLIVRQEVAVHVLYVGAVVIALFSQRQRHALIIANLCTALNVAGMFLGAPPPELGGLHWSSIINRLLTLYAVWMAVFAAYLRQRAEQLMQETRSALESQIKQRAIEMNQTRAEFKNVIASRERAEESLRQLTGALLRAQDEERRRIARELHDSTGQSLAAISVNLARLEKLLPPDNPKIADVLAHAVETAQQTSREIRTLSYLLHPPLLEEAGLASAVRWYADGFAQRSGIKVMVDVPTQFDRLAMEVETTIFRIVQESLTNISRHSKSPTAKIRIVRNAGEIMLEVQDEGVGIPPEKLEKVNDNISGLGVGIAGIWERVRQFEGDLDINSNTHGTTVTVVLPIKEEVP